MIKVGCCGFPTSMKRYFENYSLVELNSTFYEYPKLETVAGWREKAPENFEFTVKAHQDISHKSKMKLDEAWLHQVLSSLDVVHVTDPFRVLPAYTSKTAYFRLHGLGKELYYYQYTDEELRRLGEIAKNFEAEGKMVYVLFNNLAMFEDGLRFMQYLKSGEFPKITGTVGLESVRSAGSYTHLTLPTNRVESRQKAKLNQTSPTPKFSP